MSNKLKFIYVCLFIPFAVLLALTFLKIKHLQEYQQKALLAKDIRIVLENLLLDLSQTRGNILLSMPADGLWHDDPMYTIKDGHLFRTSGRYPLLVANHISALQLLRLPENPDIMEIQIEAKDRVSLESNLRIRIH